MADGYPEHPIFPLGTVLFPDGQLPLRIFEPRYLDMVSTCLSGNSPFGVCLIRAGREVGVPATPFRIGTMAHIVDWDRTPEGLLAILAVGSGRFRLHETRVRADQLLVGRCEPIDEPATPVPTEHAALEGVLRRLMEGAPEVYAKVPRRPGDAWWLGYRLAEILPLPATRRQHLLELDDPLARLEEIARILRALELTRGSSSASREVGSEEPDGEN